MSNDNLENEKPNVEANVESQEPVQEVNVEQLMARMEKLESTNERLLSESKTNKSKYQTLKSEVETKEHDDLTKNQKWEELLEIQKNKSFELEEKNKTIRQDVLRKEINFQVARYAKDAYDVDDVISSLPKDMLNIDYENLEINGVKEAIELVRESKKHLFNTGVRSHGMTSEPPAEYKEKEKELSLAELLLQGSKEGVI